MMTYKRLHLAKMCQVFQERATYGLVVVGKVVLSLDFEKWPDAEVGDGH